MPNKQGMLILMCTWMRSELAWFRQSIQGGLVWSVGVDILATWCCVLLYFFFDFFDRTIDLIAEVRGQRSEVSGQRSGVSLGKLTY